MQRNLALFLLLISGHSLAEIKSGTVNVIGQRDNMPSIADSASEGIISHARIANQPLSRPGEVLEQAPGLIVSQHSGDGKANQYYLRGFNLDHGTDFAVWLEGMPLNMPTHAHGQGYTDSNFLIPELIESLHFRKGPYYAESGDFSAAGSANLRYFRSLPQAVAKITTGNDGYTRLFNADSHDIGGDQLLYALEAQHYDGPWEKDQNLKKLNGLLRYSSGDAGNGFDILAMAYRSQWNATDQIPDRAVNSGAIGRFGAIDDTSGGKTHRYSLSADWRKGPLQASIYAIDYRLNLFSNFTYFLDDPINGDQFEQADRRRIFGGALKYGWQQVLLGLDADHEAGLQTRYDDIDNVGLYKTRARQRLSTVRQDDIKQSSFALWWQAGWELAPGWRLTTGLRADRYGFDVDSDNLLNSGRNDSRIVSPKLGIAWKASGNIDLYANWGRGFHSNDGRGSTIRVDPASGDPTGRVDPLVKAAGQEIGMRSLWFDRWQATLALFQLDIDSELLFVGDAGATEASRPSRRVGLEWTNHLPLNDWSYLDADFSITRARFRDADAVGDHIPGSVQKVASIGYAAQLGAWSASSRLRYFGPRALIEDNSVRSSGSLIVNGRIGYQAGKQVSFALDIFNLFNRKVSDIDYFYTSRLAGEPAAGIDDVHTHPAEPRMARLTMILNY